MEMVRRIQRNQNKKLVIFLQYIKKKSIATTFVFYCDTKHLDILQESSHVCCYLHLGGCGQKWEQPFRSWICKIC